jgi:hypothetical protein
LLPDQELTFHELRHHITGQQNITDHHHQQQQDHLSYHFEKQEKSIVSHHSSRPFRDLSVNSFGAGDSSSESDSNQDQTGFFRAVVHTTRRTEQEHSSSVSRCSDSASSLVSSVASSQEVQVLRKSSDMPSPVQSIVLESGTHLR